MIGILRAYPFAVEVQQGERAMLMAYEVGIVTRMLELLAAFGSGMALWAQTRVQKAEDPVADLTERLRHPFVWSLKHPVQAIRRRVR